MTVATKTDSDISYKTLYLRRIPNSCSNDQLKEVFSTMGPVKDAFIVKRKDSSDDSANKSCIGYVTYHIHEDAQKAIKSASSLLLNGAKVLMDFARKKKFSKKPRKGAKTDESEKEEVVTPKKVTPKKPAVPVTPKLLKPNYEEYKKAPLGKLYVRNIPETCTNDKLKSIFSTRGSFKQAFIVPSKTDTESDSTKKRHIGYVIFFNETDAHAIVDSEEEFTVDGVKLKIEIAKQKTKPQKTKPSQTNETEEKSNKSSKSANIDTSGDINSMINKTTLSQSNLSTEVATKNYSYLDSLLKNNPIGGDDAYEKTSVVITTMSGSLKVDTLKTLWTEKKLKKAEFNYPKNKDGSFQLSTIYAVLPSKQDAMKVVSKLNGISFQEHELKATILVDPNSKEFKRAAKKSRLIVRNLSFWCDESELASAFEKYGVITEVKIPLQPDGRKRGFAFVQFSNVFEAGKALEVMNMTEIKGRKVAVDWALPREKFKEISQEEEAEAATKEDDDSDKEGGEEKIDSEDDGEQDVESEGSDDDDDHGIDDVDSMDDDEDGDEVGGGEDSDVDDVASDDSDADSGADDEDNESTAGEWKRDKNWSSDVHEGKTLLIRNLSFDTTEDRLTEELGGFGEMKYCKVVENKATGFSKGCAFVQFLQKEDADKCLKTLNDENNKFILDKRALCAVVATSRAESKKIIKDRREKEKEKDDNRNLYLANEGLVRPGTQAAIGLSEIEISKRTRIEKAKRTKLKNHNFFVSTTRLCIHNIPRSTDEAALKKIVIKAAEDSDVKKPLVKECRIMRNRDDVNEKGVARSLGFGFVNFSVHEHALKVLRHLNNNPTIFTDMKRPIVEFSLENRLALEAQAQRAKRQTAKHELKMKMNAHAAPKKEDDTPKNVNKPRSRKERRRERALRRKEAKAVEDSKQANAQSDGAEKNATTAETNNSKSPKKNRKRKKQQKESSSGEAVEVAADDQGNDANERKPFQGSVGMTADGKKIKMPKHSGPKIRKRDKGRVVEQLRLSKKLNKQKNNWSVKKSSDDQAFKRKADDSGEAEPKVSRAGTEHKKRRRNQGGWWAKELKADAEFNSMVKKYTTKMKSPMEVKKMNWLKDS